MNTTENRNLGQKYGADKMIVQVYNVMFVFR